MSKRNRDKIVTMTTSKVIIKWGEVDKVLNKDEKTTMNKLLGKLINYDLGNGGKQ